MQSQFDRAHYISRTNPFKVFRKGVKSKKRNRKQEKTLVKTKQKNSFWIWVKSGRWNFKQGKPICKANLTARTTSHGPTHSRFLETGLNPKPEIKESTSRKRWGGTVFRVQVKSGRRNFRQGKPICKANLTVRTTSCGPTHSRFLENGLNPKQGKNPVSVDLRVSRIYRHLAASPSHATPYTDMKKIPG